MITNVIYLIIIGLGTLRSGNREAICAPLDPTRPLVTIRPAREYWGIGDTLKIRYLIDSAGRETTDTVLLIRGGR